jgi:hypothetical protein
MKKREMLYHHIESEITKAINEFESKIPPRDLTEREFFYIKGFDEALRILREIGELYRIV